MKKHPLDMVKASEGAYRKWSDEDVQAIHRARERRVSWKQIAEHFEVTTSNLTTLYFNWRKSGRIK